MSFTPVKPLIPHRSTGDQVPPALDMDALSDAIDEVRQYLAALPASTGSTSGTRVTSVGAHRFDPPTSFTSSSSSHDGSNSRYSGSFQYDTHRLRVAYGNWAPNG